MMAQNLLALSSALLLTAAHGTTGSRTPLPVPSKHGVNIHFTIEDAGELRQIALAGFDFVRMDFLWSSVEASIGVYNWSAYDALTAGLKQNGLTALFILNGRNKLYDGGLSPFTDEGIAAFTAFAVAGVKRYAGQGHVWEMYNEPNLNICPPPPSLLHVDLGHTELAQLGHTQHRPLQSWYPCANVTAYARLALSVGTAVRAAAPGEVQIGPGIAQHYNSSTGVLGPDWAFLEGVAQAGVLPLWDGVSIHPYAPYSPEGAFAEYANLTAWLASASSPSPSPPALLNSESGWSTCPGCKPTGGPLANESVQACWQVRRRLVDLLSSLPLTVAYDYRDDGDNSSYIEDNYGLTHAPYLNASLPHEPKEAWGALHALHAIFYSCTIQGALLLPPPASPASPACYAAYWDCGFMSPAFSAWCDAGASSAGPVNLSFPYTWPGEGAGWKRVYPQLPLLLEPSSTVVSLPHGEEEAPPVTGPCFYQYTMAGVNQGLVCAGGADPSSYTWQGIPGSGSPVHLRDVQIHTSVL